MTTVKRVYLKHSEFRFLRMFLQHREIYFIAGTNSMFVPSRQEKYIMLSDAKGNPICRDWDDIDGHPLLMTPSEACRTELNRTFKGLRRTGWQPQHVNLFDWRWPMMFSGASEGEGIYIDLKGAYHQIYSRLWLDVAFPCGYGTLALGGVAEKLKNWKAARNSLMGICAAREVTAVQGYKTFNIQANNPFLSPHLWATVQAILNEVAFKAESCGAIYIATDGYIFPKDRDVDRFVEFLADVGLKYRSKDGHYRILQWGAYKIGEKQTSNYRQTTLPIDKGFRSINVHNQRFPEKLVSWWAYAVPIHNLHKWKERFPYE